MNHSPPPLQADPAAAGEAIEALQLLLCKGDEADRCHASRALGALRARPAVPMLIERLRDDDIDVCIDAAEALGAIGEPSATSALLDSLEDDPRGEVKTALIGAISRLGGDDVVEALIQWAAGGADAAMWDEDEEWDYGWDVQRAAVKGLGRLRVPQAVPVLSEMLAGADIEDIEDEVIRALARIGGEGEAVLVRRLADGTPRQRRRAVRALALCKTSSAWKAVLGGIRDPEPDVRAAAVRAFGSHPEISRFLGLLLALLHDKDSSVRTAILALVSSLNIPRDQSAAAVDRLIPMLEDTDAAVRAAVIDALRTLAPDGVEQRALEKVRRCVSDDNDQVVAKACAFVARYGEVVDLPVLFDIFEDSDRDPVARREAGLAIGFVAAADEQTVEKLTWALGDASQPVRLAALTALKSIHDRCAGGDKPECRQSEGEDADRPQPTPLDVIIGVLRGEIEVTPRVDVAEESVDTGGPADPTGDDHAKVMSADQSGIDKAPILESTSVAGPEDGAVEEMTGEDDALDADDEVGSRPQFDSDPAGATSTLDAIIRDNESVAQESARSSSQPEPVDDELKDYAALVQANIERRERLRRGNKASVADDVRRLSARILGDSSEQKVIQTLIEAMNSDDSEVRRDAANSLAVIAEQIEDRSLVENAYGALVTHLFSDEYDVRLASARALGALRAEAAFSPLVTCLDDEDSGVRSQCVAALAKLLLRHDHGHGIDKDVNERAGATDKVRQCLSDTDAGVRKAAAEVLADLDVVGAVDDILQAAFIEDGGLSRDIGRALRRFRSGEEISKRLVRALGDAPHSSHRRVVIEMMEEFFRNS